MTQKELIRQEIDTRRQHMVEELMGHEENCEYHRIKGMHDAYVDLLTFLDYSLPDEKPSEDLEKAASRGGFDYVDEIEAKAPGLPWNDHDVEFGYRDGFIAGSNWQKEQIMKDAVEGVVYRYESYQRIATAIIVDIPREILGNKVKIIIVKK